MARTTIDYGIDLGTTNSVIAVLRGMRAEVIKNEEGHDATPSAVWVDKRDRLFVGRAACDRSEYDPENTAVEFKLRMGTGSEPKRFAGSGRAMRSEQLSAEVLKSLRADARSRSSEDIEAAVVTVPAAFDMSACDATRRAAELAGFRSSPLLQEPTAAALAYGFQSAEDKAMWLVYDFGGGTFDAAVIQLRDGEFTVVDHGGDNYLGGKLIDWKLVDEILIPAVVAENPAMAGLGRGDPTWFRVVSKLKAAAEQAKIQLSRADSTTVYLELTEPSGASFEFEYDLERRTVERLAEPLIVRSINLCRKALRQSGLSPDDIDRLILVGGQTMMPYLRERLADSQQGLGIRLKYDEDPMTVVARGAAIFAGGQLLPADQIAAPSKPGGYRVRLEYSPIGPDTEPLIAGKLSAPNDNDGDGDQTSLAGLSVEFVNAAAEPPWRSGKIAVPDSGVFGATLWAVPKKPNLFTVELTDATGARLDVTPNEWPYTVAAVETEPPLTHSIGVGLDDNEVLWLAERGAPLPVRQRRATLLTTTTVHVGEGGGVIRIPVLEGENVRADRNRRIGRIEVRATEVERTVPAGSEVQYRLDIDESRIIRTWAYIPLLEKEFEDTIVLGEEAPPQYDELAREVATELARLTELQKRQRSVGSPVAEMMLARIDEEQMAEDLERLAEAAKSDPDARAEAQQRVLDLRIAVDDVENELAWPVLVREAENTIADARDLVATYGSETDQQNLPMYEAAIQHAIDEHDADLLRQRTAELSQHVHSAMDRNGLMQVSRFQHLVDRRSEMRNQAHADRLMAEGLRVIESGEYEKLRGINIQLVDLFPEPPAPTDPGSTVRRAW